MNGGTPAPDLIRGIATSFNAVIIGSKGEAFSGIVHCKL